MEASIWTLNWQTQERNLMMICFSVEATISVWRIQSCLWCWLYVGLVQILCWKRTNTAEYFTTADQFQSLISVQMRVGFVMCYFSEKCWFDHSKPEPQIWQVTQQKLTGRWDNRRSAPGSYRGHSLGIKYMQTFPQTCSPFSESAKLSLYTEDTRLLLKCHCHIPTENVCSPSPTMKTKASHSNLNKVWHKLTFSVAYPTVLYFESLTSRDCSLVQGIALLVFCICWSPLSLLHSCLCFYL